MTILVVDDSKVSRGMAIGLLRNRVPGACFIEAGSGEEAVAQAAGKVLSLVVMDYNMPGINGVDAAQAILAQQPGLKVVLLTANGQSAVQGKADAAGLHFLRKPIKPELADQIAAMVPKVAA